MNKQSKGNARSPRSLAWSVLPSPVLRVLLFRLLEPLRVLVIRVVADVAAREGRKEG